MRRSPTRPAAFADRLSDRPCCALCAEDCVSERPAERLCCAACAEDWAWERLAAVRLRAPDWARETPAHPLQRSYPRTQSRRARIRHRLRRSSPVPHHYDRCAGRSRCR